VLPEVLPEPDVVVVELEVVEPELVVELGQLPSERWWWCEEQDTVVLVVDVPLGRLVPVADVVPDRLVVLVDEEVVDEVGLEVVVVEVPGGPSPWWRGQVVDVGDDVELECEPVVVEVDVVLEEVVDDVGPDEPLRWWRGQVVEVVEDAEPDPELGSVVLEVDDVVVVG